MVEAPGSYLHTDVFLVQEAGVSAHKAHVCDVGLISLETALVAFSVPQGVVRVHKIARGSLCGGVPSMATRGAPATPDLDSGTGPVVAVSG